MPGSSEARGWGESKELQPRSSSSSSCWRLWRSPARPRCGSACAVGKAAWATFKTRRAGGGASMASRSFSSLRWIVLSRPGYFPVKLGRGAEQQRAEQGQQKREAGQSKIIKAITVARPPAFASVAQGCGVCACALWRPALSAVALCLRQRGWRSVGGWTPGDLILRLSLPRTLKP